MNWQFFIVLIFIALAIGFAGRSFFRKTRSFSPKDGCAADCGCGTRKEKAL